MKQSRESKCISSEFKKEKNSDYGILFQWFSKFDNGDEGFTNTKKKEQPFLVGQMCKYDIEQKEFKRDNGDSFNFNSITKPKESRGFEKRDDSKERIKSHSLDVAMKLINSGLIALDDEANVKGSIIEDKMFPVAKRTRDIMLQALDKKGKENVFIIMTAMDAAVEFAILRANMSRLVEDFNKFIEI